jgi:hypothetical protein
MKKLLVSIFTLILILKSCSHAKPQEGLSVILHPDGDIFVGDQVSFEILGPSVADQNINSVSVSFSGTQLGNAAFSPQGLGARNEAILWWIWDTSELTPGSYELTFTTQPENSSWTKNIALLPRERMSDVEREAQWVTYSSPCCNYHTISGTQADEDVQELIQTAEGEATLVSQQLAATLASKMEITFMPRLIGQGGFANNGIYISYFDDNIIGNNMPIVLHHEFIHTYDSQMGGTYLPSMLQEGLAVYLSGGHFKYEQLMPRAAGLLETDMYIPLATLVEDFYLEQHEIGYLEAGSFVQYLIETYGWEAFNRFYRSIPIPVNQTTASVLEAAMLRDFGVSFKDVEASYLEAIRSQVIPPLETKDLETTISLFDTVRQYQQKYDQSAYFLTAWLPDGAAMRKKGIIADFIRTPENLENKVFETLLLWAKNDLYDSHYKMAGYILDSTSEVLADLNK